MILHVDRQFEIPFPGPSASAIAFIRDVQKSLENVSFIRNLRVEGNDVFAHLRIEVPFLGERLLDFRSTLEPVPDGANLIAQKLEGKFWAAVNGEGRVTSTGATSSSNDSSASLRSSIHYHLRAEVHLELPVAEKWGGRAFAKMAEATAQRTIERMAQEFPIGVSKGMPKT
jgi:carbon monoxide dehydrogenase subunit G